MGGWQEDGESRQSPNPRRPDPKATAMSTAARDELPRTNLPIPEREHVGLTTYDAKDPDTSFPPIDPLLPPVPPPMGALPPPVGAPNVLVVLIDDTGFGASSAFGGPIHTPNAERLAGDGLKVKPFPTTAPCPPTPAALPARAH